jgi:hypothetical protein
MRNIRAVRGGAAAVVVVLLVGASQVPANGRDWVVVVLLVVAALVALALVATLPRAGSGVPLPKKYRQDLLTERRLAIRRGDEAPSLPHEFADAWQDWCDELTLALRDHGYKRGAPNPETDNSAEVLSIYRNELRKRALNLLDEGNVRQILPQPQDERPTLKRSSFYDAANPDELWRIVDDVWGQLIQPRSGKGRTLRDAR